MFQATSTFLSLSVLAFAGLGLNAHADAICDLSDGFGTTPAAFQQEADACFEGLDGVSGDAFLENELRRLSNQARDDAILDALVPLSSLNEAARLHAYDMAVRHYAAHEDKEGRSHLDRVRLIDRDALIGAFGANVAVLDASMTAEQVQAAIAADKANAANLVRDGFSHVGIGAVKSDGKLYVVELFARVEGRLASPMPLQVHTRTDLQTVLPNEHAEILGWSLASAAGDELARGLGNRLTASLPEGAVGFLTLDVSMDGATYSMKGPAVSFF